MEGGDLNNMRSPLLSREGEKMIQNEKTEYRNSVNALKSEFFSKLPIKVRSGLDPEIPFHIDLSKTIGLIEGIVLRLSFFFWFSLVILLLIEAFVILHKCSRHHVYFYLFSCIR